jgi:integrase
MKVEEAAVHGRLGPVKIEYSDDELPLDPEFATVLLAWKHAIQGGDSGLVFPSHITGRCYHASPIQQDWIRRAGWCLVSCSECGAVPGARCKNVKETRHERPRIQVHDCRREVATAAGYGSIGWHTFRHKYRTLLSQADTPLEVQQKLLRHADIRTTTQYGGVPLENKRAANSRAVREILVRKSAQ